MRVSLSRHIRTLFIIKRISSKQLLFPSLNTLPGEAHERAEIDADNRLHQVLYTLR